MTNEILYTLKDLSVFSAFVLAVFTLIKNHLLTRANLDPSHVITIFGLPIISIAQLLSWITSFIMALVGSLLDEAEGVNYFHVIIYGVTAGLFANGIWDVSIVAKFLNTITFKLKSTPYKD